MKKHIIIFLIIFIFSSCLIYGQDILITNIKISNTNGTTQAEIDLNDLIKIKGINIKKNEGKTLLEFPSYSTKTGRVYEQVKILSKTLYSQIIEAINKPAEKAAKNSNQEMGFEISKFYKYNNSKSKLKVFAEVAFGQAISIECKIFEGKSGPWVGWPERKEGKNWVKIVLFKKEFKEKIENVLLQRYTALKDESSQGWE
ncbi:MAG: hypothetical protein KKH91_06930 [Elusimicrobia bacterium]|nr:hypothetical protein [Elusimicrobiota bacterium]MBU2614029.1 hypothetical protein [Elusimicrobiota bacterium]